MFLRSLTSPLSTTEEPALHHTAKLGSTPNLNLRPLGVRHDTRWSVIPHGRQVSRRGQFGVQLRDEGLQAPMAVLLRMGSKIWLASFTAVAKSGAGPGASAATFG